MPGLLDDYHHQGAFCEVMGGHAPLPHSDWLGPRIDGMELDELHRRAEAAQRELFRLGITFTVYSDRDATDRILPFDIVPRPLSADDWRTIEAGVVQRVAAINAFLDDVYHDQKVLSDGVVPRDLVLGNPNYRPEMTGFEPPLAVYTHVCGIDIVRDEDGRCLVLEDNARTPSGVSYVVENRRLMLRAFPDLFAQARVRPVSNYGLRLRMALMELAPIWVNDPQIVLLTPGVYNSAFFEHVFLAREMGVPLVEGRDLFVDEDDIVHVRTIKGPARVDVIYRRIDDDFLDPEAFNPDSLLGVPGLMRAYMKGNVALANAPGTGVADDKALYAYMPRLIRYYLDQDPILGNVETHLCREPDGLAYTLGALEKLVVKPVGGSGGYGVTVGPLASEAELARARALIEKEPEAWISQPMVSLSVCPTLVSEGIEPRRVDLRPFAVTGRDSWVLPGGLTRVALRRGSMIVNSSQGGGSKDTWVLD